MAEQGKFEVHENLMKDCMEVGDLPLSRVLLMNDSNYPWFVLVPRRPGLREVYDLDEKDAVAFWRESHAFGRLLMRHFNGHKFNVAALGNVVPQLHVHHIVRQSDDSAWPRPIWGVHPMQPYTETAARDRIATVRALLAESGLLL